MHAFLPKYESHHLMSVRNRIDHLFARLAVFFATVLAFAIAITSQPKTAIGEESPLHAHCGDCHAGNDAEGDFSLGQIGSDADNGDYHALSRSLERITAGEMPPPTSSVLSTSEKAAIVHFLKQRLRSHPDQINRDYRLPPRRLNNREFENSVRDALMIEDVGTHQPTDNLIGDSRFAGFDTHGQTLGFSNFHLEQYIESLRSIMDATILSGEQRPSERYEVQPTQIFSAHTSQNINRPERRGRPTGFDFLDPKQLAYFAPFKTVPATGWYKISIRCTALDRGYYPATETGIHDADPIKLVIQLGNRHREFELPDEEVMVINLQEWLAEGTRLRLRYPTDGLTLRGNGNFKFQNAIAGEYIKKHDPNLYKRVADAIVTKPGRRVLRPESWHHWVDYWRGPRPRILGATIEGPFYDSWPPRRHTALLPELESGKTVEDLIRPIATRAWRRTVHDGELDHIVDLIEANEEKLGKTEAFKEGIVALLASPDFLLTATEKSNANERFASKFSLFLHSTLPDTRLIQQANTNQLSTFESVHEEVRRRIRSANIQPFLQEFPYGWLNLSEINFMSPDPDRYRFYHRKRLSEDMCNEVLTFFNHVVEQDLPITEFLEADYSFINADLANIYEVSDIKQDSHMRRYHFHNGRRGGLLGMGAFLTLTADSLGTSPIHRATFVMENLMGIHPTPPPADVKIEEPDIRAARTMKDVLRLHQSEQNCATCHRNIDPFGWAFENFDSVGAWRDTYENQTETPTKKHNRHDGPRIDASSTFADGTDYADINAFRRIISTPENQERFARCFITKLLTYANGEVPSDYLEIDTILKRAKDHDYRISATIAAVIDSRLFREE